MRDTILENKWLENKEKHAEMDLSFIVIKYAIEPDVASQTP